MNDEPKKRRKPYAGHLPMHQNTHDMLKAIAKTHRRSMIDEAHLAFEAWVAWHAEQEEQQ